jgi:RHS repeat-associated protein
VDGAVRYTYDQAGRVETLREEDGTTRFTYDAEDQLTEVLRPNGSRIRYGYDAVGRRVWKDLDGKRTDVLWSWYEMAGELQDDRVTRQFSSFLMTPLGQWTEGEWFGVISNHMSVPHELVDHQSSIAWEVSLDSYGAVLSEQGRVSVPQRHRGQYHDRETDLYYNLHRSYSARLAAFLTPDPIGIQGGVNLHAYPRNPIMWDDPFGLKCGACVTNNGQRQLAPGQGNRGKGNFGESMMDDHYAAQGYTKIDAPGRSQGIDGIYHNPNANPPYVIAESKYGSSRLGRTQDSRQMSNGWIDGTSSPSTAGQTRLDHALQGSGHTPAAVQAAGAEKALVHTDAAGSVTTTSLGTYP